MSTIGQVSILSKIDHLQARPAEDENHVELAMYHGDNGECLGLVTLPQERAVQLFKDLAHALGVVLADEPGSFVLIQEGGSSTELYLHAHGSREEAEQDRIDCAQGAYRTSEILEVSPVMAALGEGFYGAVEQTLSALSTLECVSVPEEEDDSEEGEEEALTNESGTDSEDVDTARPLCTAVLRLLSRHR